MGANISGVAVVMITRMEGRECRAREASSDPGGTHRKSSVGIQSGLKRSLVVVKQKG